MPPYLRRHATNRVIGDSDQLGGRDTAHLDRCRAHPIHPGDHHPGNPERGCLRLRQRSQRLLGEPLSRGRRPGFPLIAGLNASYVLLRTSRL
jgi:hypothetical protein